MAVVSVRTPPPTLAPLRWRQRTPLNVKTERQSEIQLSKLGSKGRQRCFDQVWQFMRPAIRRLRGYVCACVWHKYVRRVASKMLLVAFDKFFGACPQRRSGKSPSGACTTRLRNVSLTISKFIRRKYYKANMAIDQTGAA